jgi:transposase
MMGPRQEAQPALFYAFSLEDHVPQDHLLRSIDRFVDLSSIRAHLADFYSHTGRPSVDPELLIRMLLVGYCFGIRSERRLCEEVHLNLAYRWFCRLDLSDKMGSLHKSATIVRLVRTLREHWRFQPVSRSLRAL